MMMTMIKPEVIGLTSPEIEGGKKRKCLNVIEAVISSFEPVNFKEVPTNIKAEPETKEGEGMRTCFKRLLSGYCRCNGLENTVRADERTGELFWTEYEFERMNSEAAKDLLKRKGKACKKALLEKINPLLKEKNKTRVMTKAFASRVWKSIAYYCEHWKFPEVSLLDPKNIFDAVRHDGSNFLKNEGNGDCGVISVLQGNALIDGTEEDKAPNRIWKAEEIKKLRFQTAGVMSLTKREKRTGKNEKTFRRCGEMGCVYETYQRFGERFEEQ